MPNWNILFDGGDFETVLRVMRAFVCGYKFCNLN